MFNATEAQTAFSSIITTVSDVLTTNFPVVVGVLGALIGLGIVIRFVKRHIAGDITWDMEYDHDMRNKVWKRDSTNF
jgi:L-lactate permease